ncbi:hypothetical protein SDC9_137862 [bioreactor metagenome]|uniref:Uncharacterized protein n=1 Tax=bioreactor metagenome TaxID=1076179 RepID=A0A645DMR8_9ZZZZ
MGFFTYSPKHLLELTEKMNDSFEKDVDLMDFFLKMGKDISSAKIDADIVIAQLSEKMPSGDKLQMFKKYKIHCLKNCFMSEDELWVEFSDTYKETLNQINLKFQETFVREFNRWNEWVDLDEFKQKVQILNMKGNRSLAY